MDKDYGLRILLIALLVWVWVCWLGEDHRYVSVVECGSEDGVCVGGWVGGGCVFCNHFVVMDAV